jgi:hypothetical protein
MTDDTDEYADYYRAIEDEATALGLTFKREPFGNGGSEMLKICGTRTSNNTVIFATKNDADEVQAFLAGYAAANRETEAYERAFKRLCDDIRHFQERADTVVNQAQESLHVDLDIADGENERKDE